MTWKRAATAVSDVGAIARWTSTYTSKGRGEEKRICVGWDAEGVSRSPGWRVKSQRLVMFTQVAQLRQRHVQEGGYGSGGGGGR